MNWMDSSNLGASQSNVIIRLSLVRLFWDLGLFYTHSRDCTFFFGNNEFLGKSGTVQVCR